MNTTTRATARATAAAVQTTLCDCAPGPGITRHAPQPLCRRPGRRAGWLRQPGRQGATTGTAGPRQPGRAGPKPASPRTLGPWAGASFRA